VRQMRASRISQYCFYCELFFELICKIDQVFCDENKGVRNYFSNYLLTSTCGAVKNASRRGAVASHPSPEKRQTKGHTYRWEIKGGHPPFWNVSARLKKPAAERRSPTVQ